MKTKVLIAAVFVVVSSLFMWNTNKTVLTGMVQDDDGQAIVFSTLEIYSADEEKLVETTLSDIEGKFKISDLTPGEYKLIIKSPGFEEKVERVKLSSRKENNIGSIKVSGNVVTLPPAIIYARA